MPKLLCDVLKISGGKCLKCPPPWLRACPTLITVVQVQVAIFYAHNHGRRKDFSGELIFPGIAKNIFPGGG